MINYIIVVSESYCMKVNNLIETQKQILNIYSRAETIIAIIRIKLFRLFDYTCIYTS